MNSLALNRTPELIAAEINSIKNQTKNIVLYNSIEIGRKLVEAKELINHGEWGNWLEESVDYSQRTAQNLMKIFEEYGSNQLTLLGNNAKTQALADLTYTQAVALLGIPSEEREEFVQENNISEMSTRELQQAIKERDSAKEALEDVRSILKEKSEEALKYYDEKSNAESEKRVANQVLKETQATVKQLQEALEKQRKKASELDSKLQTLVEDKPNADEDGLDADMERAHQIEVELLQDSIKKNESMLQESKSKIKELEQQLNTPLESVIVEKVPEEIERELAELRAKAQGGDVKVRFKVHFDILVKNFNDLLGDLEEMKEDEELHDKYRNAIHGLIDRMVERL